MSATGPGLPEFDSIAEAAEWADTHNTAPYFDSMEDELSFDADRSFRRRIRISVFLPQDAIARLREIAREKALDYHTLAEAILLERIVGTGES